MRRTEVNADWNQINSEIQRASHGRKGAVVNNWANRLNLSRAQIYAGCRDVRGKTKESPKELNTDLHLIYMVAEMKIKAMRAGSREQEMPTWRCLEQLKHMGVDGAEELTASTVNRLLREEVGFREERSFVRYEPEYALQEVQVDWSFSKYFRVAGYNENGWILKATSRALDYKKDNKRQRILIGVIIDSYSRMRYHRALIGTGESAELCLEFLTDFFNRPDDGLAFRHVGWNFRMDNGPLDSSLGQTFFDSIDRPYETIMPGQKSGNGKAERSWQEVWKFEQSVALQLGEGGTLSLQAYNSLLLQECIRQQQLAHPVEKHRKRVDMYQQSVLSQRPRPETIDIDAKKLAFQTYERTVGKDQIVSINNNKYHVPVMVGEFRTTGRRIRVLINKEGDLRGELMDQHAEPFELHAHGARKRGDFTGTPPDTTKQQINRDLDNGKSVIDRLRKTGTDIPLRRGTESHENDSSAIQGDVNRLSPPEKNIEPDSAFLSSQNPLPEVFESQFEAMTYVSKQLQSNGIEFTTKLQNHFKEFMAVEGFDSAKIRAHLNEFISTYNNTTLNQTG